ncbi:MAG: hypothetical protein K2Q22_02975, partial [Cytophagales bacterium]|nr:hypothetical protein [Cytophagales bacterium]
CVPLSFFARLIHGNPADFGDYLAEELRTLRSKFTSIFETGNDEAEIFMFRIFKAADPEIKTIRQPLQNVLSIG